MKLIRRRIGAALALALSLLIAFAPAMGDGSLAFAETLTETNDIEDSDSGLQQNAINDSEELVPNADGENPFADENPQATENSEDADEKNENLGSDAIKDPALGAKLDPGLETENSENSGEQNLQPMALMLPSSVSPHLSYFSLSDELTAPASGNDNRGIIKAHIRQYSVNPADPALLTQSGTNPFLNATVELQNDHPSNFFEWRIAIRYEVRLRINQDRV